MPKTSPGQLETECVCVRLASESGLTCASTSSQKTDKTQTVLSELIQSIEKSTRVFWYKSKRVILSLCVSLWMLLSSGAG